MTPQEIEAILTRTLEQFGPSLGNYSDPTTFDGLYNIIKRLRDAIHEGKRPEELTHA